VEIEFSMVLEFIKLELHQKISKFFHGTRVHGTQVPWKTRFSQNRVSKKW